MLLTMPIVNNATADCLSKEGLNVNVIGSLILLDEPFSRVCNVTILLDLVVAAG